MAARVMAMAMRVECNKESNGFGGKSNGNKGGNNQLAMGACDKEGKGGKAIAMRIRVAGDKESEGNEEGNGISNNGGVQRREQWLWWQVLSEGVAT
jgi:hypothetical protein